MRNTNNGIRKCLETFNRGDVIGYANSPYLLVKCEDKPIINPCCDATGYAFADLTCCYGTRPSVYLLVDRTTQKPICYRDIWDGDLIGRDFRKLGTVSRRDAV